MNEMPDTMSWDAYIGAWTEHAKLDAFKRRVERAITLAREAVLGEGIDGARIRHHAMLALSGGKDSVALAGVIGDAGLAEDVHAIHCHTDLDVPEMDRCAEDAADALDLSLEVIEPIDNVWGFLQRIDATKSILDDHEHAKLRNFCASGNMLVSAMYERGLDVSLSGMRKEESRGRRMNRLIRGELYQLRDSTWMSLPIVDWSARDVFAMIVSRALPIHPHYRLLLDRFAISPESPASRVDCALVTEALAARGSLVHCRSLYPTLWRRLVTARPEIAQYGG